MKLIKLFSFLLLFLVYSPIYSQVELFKDFNKLEEGSYPTTFIELNNLTFFVIKERANYFLYKTDGITNNTELVNEIPIAFPQFEQSSRNNLFLDNGYLFYITQRMSENGIISEIWRTNETENILIGELGYFGRILGFIDSLPIFSTSNQIMKFDEMGNKIVLLNEPSGDSFNFKNHIPQKIGNDLYFFTYFSSDFINSRLWKTDGSETGTILIDEIDSLFNNNNLQENINYRLTYRIGNTIYFFFERLLYQNDVVFTQELYKYENGIISKVKVLTSTNNSSNLSRIRNITNLNEKLIFIFEGQNSQIWISDGTEFGTKIVKTLNTVFEKDGKFWGNADGKLFFNGSETNDFQLWQTDGTSANTFLFKTLDSQGSILLSTFFNLPNGFIFKTNENKIWASDGTQTNTVVIGDFPVFYDDMGFDNSFNFSYNANLSEFHFNYFTDSTDFEPFKMNAEDKEIKLIKNINQSTKSYLSSTYRTQLGTKWYFSGTDNDSTKVIWRSDGTLEGTIPLKTKGDRLYFFGMSIADDKIFVNLRIDKNDSSKNRIGLISTDSDSLKIIELAPGLDNLNFEPQMLTALGSKIVFRSNNNRLWVSDGTTSGTFSLQVFNSSIDNLYEFNGKVYFTSQNGFWATDGTVTGTSQIIDNLENLAPLSAFDFFKLNDKMYFFSQYFDGSLGSKMGLYESDGTKIGTKIVHSYPANYSRRDPYLNFISVLDNKAIFPLNYRLVNGNVYWIDIWQFDGLNVSKLFTIEGIRKGSYGIYTFKTAILNNKHLLFFNSNQIPEIIKANILSISSDLTKTETILETKSSLAFTDVGNFENKVVFGFGNHVTGRELWSTDGTSYGTYLIEEIFPGFKDSHPSNFMLFDTILLFTAFTPEYGGEVLSYKSRFCEGNLNYTISSGNWNDSSTWSCGRVPSLTEKAVVKSPHKINLAAINAASCGMLITELGSVLSFESGSVFSSKP